MELVRDVVHREDHRTRTDRRLDVLEVRDIDAVAPEREREAERDAHQREVRDDAARGDRSERGRAIPRVVRNVFHPIRRKLGKAFEQAAYVRLVARLPASQRVHIDADAQSVAPVRVVGLTHRS